jgi:dTDP-4-dehydrorhamnose reductase
LNHASTLLFGANGYIGGHIRSLYPSIFCTNTDIGNQAAVQQELDEKKPTVVINCAGKTGRPNVDWCEDHKEETFHSNVLGPIVLAEECLKRNIYFVHIGSGCIYSGDNDGKGFSEEDAPNFFESFYSYTKAMSDQALRRLPVLQLRLRMPFEGTHSPRNLITKILKYDRVLDCPNSLTYIPDFLRALDFLLQKKAISIYNIVNTGGYSPYQLMQDYARLVDNNHHCERVALDQFTGITKAARSNCILSTEKLEKEGFYMLSAEEAVEKALEALTQAKKD